MINLNKKHNKIRLIFLAIIALITIMCNLYQLFTYTKVDAKAYNIKTYYNKESLISSKNIDKMCNYTYELSYKYNNKEYNTVVKNKSVKPKDNQHIYVNKLDASKYTLTEPSMNIIVIIFLIIVLILYIINEKDTIENNNKNKK